MRLLHEESGGAPRRRLGDWFARNYFGSGPALNAAAMAAAAVVLGVSWADVYWPGPAGYCLSALAVFLVLMAASYLAYRLLRLWLGKDLRWAVSLAVLTAASVEFFRRGAGEGYSARVIAASLTQLMVAGAKTILSSSTFTPYSCPSSSFSSVN